MFSGPQQCGKARNLRQEVNLSPVHSLSYYSRSGPSQQIPLMGCLPTSGQDFLHDVPFASNRYLSVIPQHTDLQHGIQQCRPGKSLYSFFFQLL